jgi:hypothetical protein
LLLLQFWHDGSAKGIFAPYIYLFLIKIRKCTVKDQFDTVTAPSPKTSFLQHMEVDYHSKHFNREGEFAC